MIREFDVGKIIMNKEGKALRSCSYQHGRGATLFFPSVALFRPLRVSPPETSLTAAAAAAAAAAGGGA